nr:hypothetical protein [Tanacetum cinerariifolium]
EKEEPQEEEEDDMEVGIEKDENEPELTYLYEEVDPFNPPSPASESDPEDVMRLRTRLNPGMRLFLLVFMRQVSHLLPFPLRGQ